MRTKLYMPPLRPTLVPRQRLIGRLNEGMYNKLILISAPPGFGKTTLLCEWIRQSKIPVAWLSLDRSDNDPVQFLIYIIAALKTIEENIGDAALSILNSPRQPALEAVLTSIINDITAIPYDFVLVLDDYHLADTIPIHNALTFLIDHLPLQMHLIVATRVDPPLPLARLRARNQLMELRAADLCFNPQETTLFFKIMKLNLSSDDIVLLQTRTEGWIAGLQLAALSLQGRADIDNFIRSFTGDDRHIVDYLAEEVLTRQPEHIQKFLLHTSILDRLCGELCDAVTGQNNSQEIINELEKANLFIVPLDNKRRWYRYHHLFADLLRYRLRRENPDLKPMLHLRACEWYASNGLISDAIDHAMAAEDFERVAGLLEPIAMKMVMQSKLSTLQGWLTKLPDELIGRHPWLCLSRAWACFLTGHLDAIEPLLEKVEAKLTRPSELRISASATDRDEILGHILAIRAFLARGKGDITLTIKLSCKGFQRLPADDSVARSALALNLGYAYFLSGGMESAYHYLEQAYTIAKKIGSPFVALVAIYSQGDILRKQGKLRDAANTYRRALRLGTDWGKGHPLPATGYAYVGLSQIFYEWNKPDEAASYVTRGIKLGEESADHAIIFRGYITLAQLKQAKGETRAALSALKRAEEIADQSLRILEDSKEWQVHLWRVRIWLKQGNLEEAFRWAAAKKISEIEELNYLNEFEYLTLARVLIAQNRIDEALKILNGLLETAKAERRTESKIEILILQALSSDAEGDTALALSALREALSLAEAEGYIRIFADEGVHLTELLHKILEAPGTEQSSADSEFSPAYVKKLLLASRLSAPLSTKENLPEPISGRELEVLQCIGAGLSNREISEKLLISLNTVKTHLKNINDKLNVHNRTQAV
ncbi:MAG: tetratricopeptide repeat protein, partial [Calditrichaeota bacterium]|nr:tetratricopeptide repeat protein [Calditrichota bacterium]